MQPYDPRLTKSPLVAAKREDSRTSWPKALYKVSLAAWKKECKRRGYILSVKRAAKCTMHHKDLVKWSRGELSWHCDDCLKAAEELQVEYRFRFNKFPKRG